MCSVAQTEKPLEILGETRRGVALDNRGVQSDRCVDLGECECGHRVVRRLEDKGTHTNCRIEGMILRRMRVSTAWTTNGKSTCP